jgi:hypothetical protein
MWRDIDALESSLDEKKVAAKQCFANGLNGGQLR